MKYAIIMLILHLLLLDSCKGQIGRERRPNGSIRDQLLEKGYGYGFGDRFGSIIGKGFVNPALPPTSKPSATPSFVPSISSTSPPTVSSTPSPSVISTPPPTLSPTVNPTSIPTAAPTKRPIGKGFSSIDFGIPTRYRNDGDGIGYDTDNGFSSESFSGIADRIPRNNDYW